MFIACLRTAVKDNWISDKRRKLEGINSYKNEGAMTVEAKK